MFTIDNDTYSIRNQQLYPSEIFKESVKSLICMHMLCCEKLFVLLTFLTAYFRYYLACKHFTLRCAQDKQGMQSDIRIDIVRLLRDEHMRQHTPSIYLKIVAQCSQCNSFTVKERLGLVVTSTENKLV